MAVVTVMTGRASVLYTFYPPLTASAFYYIGLVLVVVGSWIWCAIMIVAMARWKRDNPGRPVPLAMFATVANAIMWLWTTLGVAAELLIQVIPAAFGWTETIDVGLSRTLFSWTLHAIVYFWLFPAYIAFYTMAPAAAGGRLYSETMGRLSFVLFLLYSLPVGMHHLFMDPEHSTGFKFIQSFLTFLVTIPTLLTVFTITASFEIAGRLRGGTGLFGWIRALPWDRPMVLATGLAFFMLWFGGGGGLINMSYGMNAMVHNTSWVTAHFHLIFGGTVVIMYFAIAYEIWPALTGTAAGRGRAGVAAPAALALGDRHAGHDLALALARAERPVAPGCPFRLCRPGDRVVGTVGRGQPDRRRAAGRERFTVRLESGAAAREADARSALRRPRVAYALPLHPVARVPAALNGFALWNVLGPRVDDRRLRLADRSVRGVSVAGGRDPPGRRHGIRAMSVSGDTGDTRVAALGRRGGRRAPGCRGRARHSRHPDRAGERGRDRSVYGDLPRHRDCARFAGTPDAIFGSASLSGDPRLMDRRDIGRALSGASGRTARRSRKSGALPVTRSRATRPTRRSRAMPAKAASRSTSSCTITRAAPASPMS